MQVTVIEALWDCRILEMRLPHVWGLDGMVKNISDLDEI